MPPPPTPACRGHSGSDSGSVAQDVTRPGQAHASPIAPRPDGPCVKPRPSSHPRRLFVQGYEHDPRVIHAQPIHERGIHGKKRRPPALIGTVPITALAEAGRIIHGNHPRPRLWSPRSSREESPTVGSLQRLHEEPTIGSADMLRRLSSCHDNHQGNSHAADTTQSRKAWKTDALAERPPAICRA